MRRSLLALAVAATFAPTLAAAQTVTAPLGRAVRVPLRGAAADVVVGDPKIADVTVVSPTALFVAGKGYGSTNLVVMDVSGRTVFSGQITVPVPDEGQVTVQRGREAVAFFCAPNCNRMVGANAAAGEIAAADNLSTDGAAPAPPPPAAAAATMLR